ncbi:MAG: PEGA domain-containing protein [Candidatus Kuenenia sp.]|nr:PEGA domain-containing protein [Candidatus Kuenenia hertensis]
MNRRVLFISSLSLIIIVSLLISLLSDLRARPENKILNKCNEKYYGSIDVNAGNYVGCNVSGMTDITDYTVMLKGKTLDETREYFMTSSYDICSFDNLPEGKYTIIIKKDGYEKIKQKYNLKENQYIHLTSDMVEKNEEGECSIHYSSINVNASYFQANTCKNKYLDKVYVTLKNKDGKEMEAFINNNVQYYSRAYFGDLRPNTYTIRAYKEKGGFKPAKYKVKLKEGQSVRLTIQMEKEN